MGVEVLLLTSKCSVCGKEGYNWYCRGCAELTCDDCSCDCGQEDYGD